MRYYNIGRFSSLPEQKLCKYNKKTKFCFRYRQISVTQMSFITEYLRMGGKSKDLEMGKVIKGEKEKKRKFGENKTFDSTKS